MTLIRAHGGVITQINVFTTPVGGQQALIDQLTKAVACAREEPGWLSANLHRSLDGTRVVNYAQSESLEAAQAVIERLKAGGFIDRNAALGHADPGLYEVVATFGR
jgi:quinol monooxygenase YgiN